MEIEKPAFLADIKEGVLTLSFNRPEFGNAIPQTAVDGLTALFCSVPGDASVRAVLVRGEGKHFTAGGDLRNFSLSLDQSHDERRKDWGERLDRVGAMVEAYLAIDVPIVAACRGAVAGAGLLFALGADYVVADETVNFMFSHQRVGLSPDGGVSMLLPRVVGYRRAGELLLTAATVTADEAFRIGLASRLVQADALDADAAKLAGRMARGPAQAIKHAKALLKSSATLSTAGQLDAERDAIMDSVVTPDFEEGVRAFLEKRIADFPSAR